MGPEDLPRAPGTGLGSNSRISYSAQIGKIAGTADFGDVMCSKDTQLRVFSVQGRERDTQGVLYRSRPAIDGQEDGLLIWRRGG